MAIEDLLSRQKPRSNSRGRRVTPEASKPKATRENRRRSAAPASVQQAVVPVEFGSPDPYLLAALLGLVAFGLLMVFSASGIRAQRVAHDSLAVIRLQVYHAAIALPAALIIAHWGDYRWLRRWTYPLLAVTVALLLATVVGFGHVSGGSSRWLSVFGLFRVQPAEIAKLTVICWLADSLARKSEHIKSFTVGFLPHTLGAAGFAYLCMKQPDFGSAAMIGLLLFVMLFAAGAPLGYLLGLGLAALPVAYFAVAGSEYRMKRITSFLDETNNYQLFESKLGFGSGGIFGVGFGGSHQKLFYLPEAHTDFISAIIAEEFGLFGFCLLMCAYFFLMYRGLKIAWNACDNYGMYLSAGISLFIGMQAFTNLAVAVGVLPTKGLVLPFISYGGSSLIVNCCAVGLLANVSRQRRAASPASFYEARPVGGVS